MNMVRIGGTFAYETEQFHDLCDELGIMVWQDFMFANMDYPWRDAAFASLASQEATQTLGVLQSRPSLVVLCGNSEVDQQAAMQGLQDWQESVDSDAMLGDLVRTMTPGEVWLPTTPTGGTLPFQVDSGVSHYYGVGAYRRPFDDARRAGVRFAAECLAFSNVPEDENIDAFLHDGESPGSHPRWKEGVPRDAAAGWDFEDVRDHYVERLFGVRPDELRARDPARYLALGRVATGEAMLRTFAEWRRPGSTCRGGLVWFSRDLRPGAGWGVIDAEDRPKPCYWYLKRALAPVALLSADEGLNGLWLHAVNDSTEPLDAVLRVTLYRNGLRCGVPALTTLSVPARGHETVHADALFDRFLDLTYAYRFGPPAHDVVVTTLRDRKSGKFLATATYWPGLLGADVASDVGLTVRTEPANDGCALVLETKRFAHAIAIDLDGYIPDDNYFDLEPRDVRTISLRLAGGDRAARGSVSALNSPRDVPIAVTETVDAG
jgi:beta-mannosidase